MSVRTERGFTLVEVMLSVMLLTVGVMALVGSAAMTQRMIGGGKESTFLAQRSAARIDYLRQLAASTAAPCTAAGFANGDTVNTKYGVRETWAISTPVGAPNTRLIELRLRYKRAGRALADTVKTLILCK